MRKGWMIAGIVAVILVIVLAGVYFKRLGIRKHEILLVNRYEAQFGVVENELFNMRTTIKNMHNCTDEWSDKFIAVVAEQVKGRPGRVAGDGTGGAAQAGVIAGATGAGTPMAGVMTDGTSGGNVVMTRESESLGIPPELYVKLSNAIEGKIGGFVAKQNVLIDLWRAHKTYCEDPAINEFWRVPLLAKVQPKPEMITSAATKAAVESKQMDEALF